MRVALAAGLTVALGAACASGPARLYPGPARPASESALLRESAKAAVFGIDGRRVRGSSWSLLPGRHEIWLRVRLHTDEFNMRYTVWSFCRLTLEARAGEGYETRVRTRKTPVNALDSRLQIEVGVADESGVLRSLARHCTAKRPDLG